MILAPASNLAIPDKAGILTAVPALWLLVVGVRSKGWHISSVSPSPQILRGRPLVSGGEGETELMCHPLVDVASQNRSFFIFSIRRRCAHVRPGAPMATVRMLDIDYLRARSLRVDDYSQLISCITG